MDFSVSMSVYGGDNPQHFKIALESVFNQTAKPAEVVLVVDGPIPEETSQIIKIMQDVHSNLKVLYLEKNMGHGWSRRHGLQNCSNELVAIMDSDDISIPGRFEKELKLFDEDKELSVVGGYITEFEGDIENIIGIRKVPLDDCGIKQYMKSRCPFNQVSVMFNKSSVENVGGFIDWHCEEDYFLWIRMALAGYKFKNLPDNLVFVRMNADSYMRRGGWRYFKSEALLQIYMYKNRLIGICQLCSNILVRLMVQMLVPNKIRKWLFLNCFRAAKG